MKPPAEGGAVPSDEPAVDPAEIADDRGLRRKGLGLGTCTLAETLNHALGPLWPAMARHHDPRPRHPRHRHPQQRAVHRQAGLEPPALRQGPGQRPPALTPERAAQHVVEDVPGLRIIDDEPCNAVKARQMGIRESEGVSKARATRFWERRRAQHLLSGLVHCGSCGSRMASVGKDYLALLGGQPY